MAWNIYAVMSPRIRSRSQAALTIATKQTVTSIQTRAPRQSGELANSVKQEPVHPSGDRFSTKIFADSQHAEWVYKGTGFFGPAHSAIVPTSSNYLVFDYGGEEIHAVNVAGQRPQKEWWDGPLREWSGLIKAALATLR
jgi:hypothetical protein